MGSYHLRVPLFEATIIKYKSGHIIYTSSIHDDKYGILIDVLKFFQKLPTYKID